MLKRAFLSGLLLLGAVLPLAAQETSDTLWVPTNRLSVGIGLNGWNLLLTAMYSRNISSNIELEGSFWNANSSSYDLVTVGQVAGIDKYDLSFRNFSTLDATALFSISDRRKDIHNNFPRLRFGAGLSVQYQKWDYSRVYRSQSAAIQRDSILIPQPLFSGIGETLFFGVNAKLDYVLPVAQTLDIGFRGQYHLLLFFPGQASVNFSGGLSLVAFASVRF